VGCWRYSVYDDVRSSSSFFFFFFYARPLVCGIGHVLFGGEAIDIRGEVFSVVNRYVGWGHGGLGWHVCIYNYRFFVKFKFPVGLLVGVH